MLRGKITCMEPLTKIPRAVIVGIVLAIVLDTVIQIFWKLAVGGDESTNLVATAIAALSNGYFYLAMLAFAAQLVNWLKVLEHADLSFAQPFTALSYITVLVISSYSLHENISVWRLFGVALILCGVVLISRTSHSTGHRKAGGPPADGTTGGETSGG
jgi:drug/metabolite transporter (DMT)-like permease